MRKINIKGFTLVELLVVIAIIAVLMGAKISEYATVIVMALMVSQLVLGVATLRLPKIMPAALQKAEFQIAPFLRVFFALGLIVFSSIFLFIGAQGSPVSAVVLGLILLTGVIYYLLRKNFMASRDINMENWVMEHIEENVAMLDD